MFIKFGSAASTISPTGGGVDKVFYLNQPTVTTNYTLEANINSLSAGPITINSGVTVTIPDSSTWTVV